MMRSFYKIICGAAVAFLSLGLLLGAMGFLLGGRPGGLYEYSQTRGWIFPWWAAGGLVFCAGAIPFTAGIRWR